MGEFTAPDVAPDPVPQPPAAEVPGPEPGPPPSSPVMLTGDLVPGAPVLAGATLDSDLDGAPDTAVAEVADELVLATDLDHDGRADAVTRIGPDTLITARAGEAAPAVEHPWDAAPPPAPWVDPHTGEWIRG